ncbi:MAG: HAMP domain-containing histidine kinase [Deltaproteobacteria bacterium]|nr:HAMP domain-containing histidine kinase [Deltaproteobacteria bacterium]
MVTSTTQQSGPHAGSLPGLRSQLIGGLAVILLVATVSVGVLTSWAVRLQSDRVQMSYVKTIGKALAAVLGGPLARADHTSVVRSVAHLSADAPFSLVEVVDEQFRRVASRGSLDGRGDGLRRALRTEQEVVQVRDLGRIEVAAPIYFDGQLRGALRVQMPLAGAAVDWPMVFWVLMALDGLMLVVFVVLVSTRYVIRPLQRIQQAASAVAGGDLQVKLSESGAAEFASLADSFNKMAVSIQDQLDQIARQQATLIQSEKLASVGRLAAGIAHEVGNPMQSIVGFTELLLDGGLDDAEIKDALERMRAEAERIHQTLRQLLDYSRPADQLCDSVDLLSLVREALALVAPQQRFRELVVQVVESSFAGVPEVRANRQQLAQVLVNLLLNAADACAGAGEIRIAARRGKDRVSLLVSNDGPSITAADRLRIFDPFFTTKDPGQGTGLGLAISAAIVDGLGGALTLEDGEPTTFAVSLPIIATVVGHDARSERKS